MQTLLVVDDNPVNCDLLGRRLTRAGYTVVIAGDGQQALNQVMEQPFDLVLLDIMMPDMDGLTVLGLLRRTYSRSELPVIMVTAKDDTDDIVSALEQGANDYITKPINFPVVLARVQAQLSVKQANDQVRALAAELEQKNEFIRSTFGRYVSSEVVENLLDNPAGLGFEGETRSVSVLFADLRGFTLLADTLPPGAIVDMLNTYLEEMTGVIGRYNGIASDILGDGIIAFFGAPVADPQHASHAVACAVAMQQAMQQVNERNRAHGLPELLMGIGINSGEGVAGNIGSQTRSKYTVIGSVVNMAARIEASSAGRQILISEATLAETGAIVRLDGQRTIQPKGALMPVRVYHVSGIGGNYQLFVDRIESEMLVLASPVQVECTPVQGKQVDVASFTGQLVRLSRYSAQLQSDTETEIYSDLRIRLRGNDEHVYAKVLEHSGSDGHFVVHFSSLSPAASDLISELMKQKVSEHIFP
jgi:class 3 adenylate cyclase